MCIPDLNAHGRQRLLRLRYASRSRYMLQLVTKCTEEASVNSRESSRRSDDIMRDTTILIEESGFT